MNEMYRDLLTLAARIPPGSEGGVAQEYLDEACADHARELLRDGGDPHEIVAFLDADLTALADDPGASPRAVELVRRSLMANFDLQARKNEKRRGIIALIPLVLIALLLAGYVGLKYANVIAIPDPIDTHKGIVERAHAMQKVLAFDDWKLEEIPSSRGRFFVWLYAWPSEPVESEAAGAKELADKLLSISASLARDGCGMAAEGSSGFMPGATNLLGLRLFLDNTTRALIAKDGKWETKPANTLRDTVRAYQCPNLTGRPQTGLSQ
jgi:hypothetical protein